MAWMPPAGPSGAAGRPAPDELPDLLAMERQLAGRLYGE